ncbi:MAG: RNA pseudouridine synthase [Pseudomonadota bacterium]
MRNRQIPSISETDRRFVDGILIQDDYDILVFNKPSGLAVQTRGNRGRNLDHLLWAFARSNGKRPRLVHRLDSGTSGVLLAAKTKPAAVHLSKQFELQSARKRYLAVVKSKSENASGGVVDKPLETLSGRPPRAEVSISGKAARTHWRVLQVAGDFQLLEIKPESGRMHQIRAHMASIGAPLYGDLLYGGPQSERLMLHAASIEVESLRGDRKVYTAPTGQDWKIIIKTLGFSVQE